MQGSQKVEKSFWHKSEVFLHVDTSSGENPAVLSLDGGWQGDFDRKSQTMVVKIKAVTDQMVVIGK